MKSWRSQTRQEAQNLERVMRSIREEWGFGPRVDLDFLVKHWRTTVEQAEQGYPLTFGDYTHDLEYRDSLAEIIRALEPRLQHELLQCLRDLDQRFEVATLAVRAPLLPPLEGEELGSWWFRVPRKLRSLPEDKSWYDLPPEAPLPDEFD